MGSDPPPGYSTYRRRGVALREHAEGFVGSVLDAMGLERAAVVANSMGGLWALWYARKEPGRISVLALLGCPASAG